MAKVKDRLIFETKKISAFEQRKANREQKLRSKEIHAKKLTDKARYKKDHMKQVADWAKDAAANRPSGGRVRDDDGYGELKFGDGQGNRGKGKRAAADKRYGHGGKRARFKQMDRHTIADMSSFNPKGNFGGLGKKHTKTRNGSGAQRQGKRARDAKRQR